MKVNPAFFYSLFALGISTVTMSSDVYAKNKAADERWFEVEVILFQQLGNKNELKEQFPEDIDVSSLPNYQKSFDLLGPHIQPDLTNIKQFLPLCSKESENNIQPVLLHPLKRTNATFDKKVNQLTQITAINTFELRERADISSQNLLFDNLTHKLLSTDTICAISQQEMERLFDKEQLANMNINSVEINALPNKLNALGIHNEYNPYLIADESLLLTDISQRLRWSKTFKPLLHFGWRQVGVTQKDAIPLKLFAGQNLAHEYQKALEEYQLEVEKEKLLEENLINQLTKTQNSTLTTESTNIERSRNNQQVLNQIFTRFNAFSREPIDIDTINKTVNQVNEMDLETIIATNSVETIVNKQHSELGTPLKAPIQPWFLDGFLKIHLDHYLYITADFNVFNESDLEKIIKNVPTSSNDSTAKLINFSQNRRVITGEIHYFDHPYIGMIVQIRRFDPTKPEGEQVSQAIK
ncbi:CsiV family protein [Colwellia sp. 1_MG-2023]|uniref:CsiV family protein n=1 Tax=unclassified Colwellia TaxID=196834 RepID=UPI001C09B9BD|nr:MULTISPECIES: CsiV family protein [unclassified Colwellia]MBU2925755.1 peptidoglycan binding protein CsiV [Colwellia sp. C2M11]MDO6651019.1 CsiV family protein [Colwellia sp. 3_MG-2023]MDO6664054.1 CsiV family protein [Colwellia sp. 2_MG-2023]MDO6688405.1 CsiV family protein [Colwellia sp. 1_MG-2023]